MRDLNGPYLFILITLMIDAIGIGIVFPIMPDLMARVGAGDLAKGSVAAGILTESAVSFLGFGIAHPGASWGALVNETRNPGFWWIQVFPGFLIFLTVTCYNLVGDALRDLLDPRMRKG